MAAPEQKEADKPHELEAYKRSCLYVHKAPLPFLVKKAQEQILIQKEYTMKVFFLNPSFKAKYGKFSRENRSPTVTRSGTLYYPLWLIYAAAVCEKDGFEVSFLDAPAR